MTMLQTPTPTLTLYSFHCRICGKSWTRSFLSEHDAKNYLLFRDTCMYGFHEAEPNLGYHVSYKPYKS